MFNLKNLPWEGYGYFLQQHNMQIFTLGNPVRFGLKWFVKEETSLAVYEATVPNNRQKFNLQIQRAIFTNTG